jgi:hypothetical protein
LIAVHMYSLIAFGAGFFALGFCIAAFIAGGRR